MAKGLPNVPDDEGESEESEEEDVDEEDNGRQEHFSQLAQIRKENKKQGADIRSLNS